MKARAFEGVTKPLFSRLNYKMQEKDLVRTIEQLRSIEPRKDWVLSTKGRIFAEYDFEHAEPKRLWGFFLKPVAVLPLAALAVIGIVFSFSALQDLKTTNFEVAQLKADLQEIQKLTLSLENLQSDILEAKESLEGTEISSPKMVLEMSEGVKNAAVTGREVIEETRKIAEAASSSQEQLSILASITDTEKAIEDFEMSYQEKVKVVLESLIEEMEHWALGEEDLQKFEEAKQVYQEGRYSEALERILTIGY